ncbi:hypothetical protein [Deinococcus frigens]|uniref:hypothetical protein n=1 Tax=Deinococcus frigens TaxID=249403 RepID=UPI0012EBC5AD|nr:hypothetical protein [Deinococcus frigens]
MVGLEVNQISDATLVKVLQWSDPASGVGAEHPDGWTAVGYTAKFAGPFENPRIPDLKNSRTYRVAAWPGWSVQPGNGNERECGLKLRVDQLEIRRDASAVQDAHPYCRSSSEAVPETDDRLPPRLYRREANVTGRVPNGHQQDMGQTGSLIEANKREVLRVNVWASVQEKTVPSGAGVGCAQQNPLTLA